MVGLAVLDAEIVVGLLKGLNLLFKNLVLLGKCCLKSSEIVDDRISQKYNSHSAAVQIV